MDPFWSGLHRIRVWNNHQHGRVHSDIYGATYRPLSQYSIGNCNFGRRSDSISRGNADHHHASPYYGDGFAGISNSEYQRHAAIHRRGHKYLHDGCCLDDFRSGLHRCCLRHDQLKRTLHCTCGRADAEYGGCDGNFAGRQHQSWRRLGDSEHAGCRSRFGYSVSRESRCGNLPAVYRPGSERYKLGCDMERFGACVLRRRLWDGVGCRPLHRPFPSAYTQYSLGYSYVTGRSDAFLHCLSDGHDATCSGCLGVPINQLRNGSREPVVFRDGNELNQHCRDMDGIRGWMHWRFLRHGYFHRGLYGTRHGAESEYGSDYRDVPGRCDQIRGRDCDHHASPAAHGYGLCIRDHRQRRRYGHVHCLRGQYNQPKRYLDPIWTRMFGRQLWDDFFRRHIHSSNFGAYAEHRRCDGNFPSGYQPIGLRNARHKSGECIHYSDFGIALSERHAKFHGNGDRGSQYCSQLVGIGFWLQWSGVWRN